MPIGDVPAIVPRRIAEPCGDAVALLQNDASWQLGRSAFDSAAASMWASPGDILSRVAVWSRLLAENRFRYSRGRKPLLCVGVGVRGCGSGEKWTKVFVCRVFIARWRGVFLESIPKLGNYPQNTTPSFFGQGFMSTIVR